MRGLEPRASCSQSRRATNCATPRYEIVGLPGRILPKKRDELEKSINKYTIKELILQEYLYRKVYDMI